MCRPGSIYVISLCSVFEFQTHFHCNESDIAIGRDTIIFCTFFRISRIIFG